MLWLSSYSIISYKHYTHKVSKVEKAVIAGNKPSKIRLEKDKQYAYCICGLSEKQPFCDGSHQHINDDEVE